MTAEQVAWIEVRDSVGEAIDRYMATAPPREMRLAVQELEQSLRDEDRSVGLA